MKRVTVLLALVVVVVMSASFLVMAAHEQGGPKGKEVNLSGRLSCTLCTLSHPDKTCKKGCCAGCIKGGDPPLLVDEDGNMYILLSNEIKKPLMTPERLQLAGEKVTIKGLLIKGKGIQAIVVDSVEEL